MEEIKLISFLLCFCVVCGFSYWGMQKLNFKNLFAPDSTKQIRVLILLVVIGLGLVSAMGFSYLVGLISEVVTK